MKDRLSELGSVVWISALILVAVIVIGGGLMVMNGVALPSWLQFQRNAVEQSKSYTDATNLQMANMITEYNGLDVKIAVAGEDKALIKAYVAQQKALLGQMCAMKSTMQRVNSDTLAFLAKHGGCE